MSIIENNMGVYHSVSIIENNKGVSIIENNKCVYYRK